MGWTGGSFRIVKRGALAVVLLCGLALTGCTAHAATVKHTERLKVPSVAGENLTAAEASLNAAHLTSTYALPAVAGSLTEAGTCYRADSTTPAAGTTAQPGDLVTINVQPITMSIPNVVGLTYGNALSTLTTSCFIGVAPSSTESNWKVTAQAVAPGTEDAAGTQVTLTVQAPPPPVTVFTITGNGSQSSTITWTIPGTFDIEQATNVSLPWSKTFPDAIDGTHGNISAQDDDGTSISCTITVDGQVVDSQTATGEYAIVQCGG